MVSVLFLTVKSPSAKIRTVEERKYFISQHSVKLCLQYAVSDMWFKDNLDNKEETCKCHVLGYSFSLTARDILYVTIPQTGYYISQLCYTSCVALAGMNRYSETDKKSSENYHVLLTLRYHTIIKQ